MDLIREINSLIAEAIDEECKSKPELKKLILRSLQEEYDTHNRYISANERNTAYDKIVSGLMRGKN